MVLFIELDRNKTTNILVYTVVRTLSNTATDHCVFGARCSERQEGRVESSSDIHDRQSFHLHRGINDRVHAFLLPCTMYRSHAASSVFLLHPLCVRVFRSATAGTRVLDRLTNPLSLSLSHTHFLAEPLTQMHSKSLRRRMDTSDDGVLRRRRHRILSLPSRRNVHLILSR